MPRIRAGSIAEHKQRTRDEILAAAAALFRAQGYADTALGDIAGYVGIGRTTLYEYFADKEDVLVTLVEETLPGVVDGMLADLPDGLTHRERLGELMVRGLEFVSTDDDLGSTLMRELPRLSGRAQARVRAAHSRLEDEVTGLCRDGIAAGEFSPLDPADAGRIVFTMMMSASGSLLRDADAKQRVHEVADTLVRFVFDGLAAGSR
jgi:AcrR family transcriptional regulator